MRCMTLADALKQREVRIRFVSRHLPEHFQAMLAVKGHEFTQLNSMSRDEEVNSLPHSRWLGTSQQVDAQETIRALSDQAWDWLIVDHYALDSYWESVLRQAAKKILVIDDIADRKHDCDLLLDQNLYGDMTTRYSSLVPAQCQLLLGPHYALLRDEFQMLRENLRHHVGEVQRVFVFFGGMDADNYTESALVALANSSFIDLQVDVVIGSQHPCREQIEAQCIQHGFYCHVQTHRMAQLMAEADLAIGAGGSVTWERCCLGLPTLAICVADNQFKQIAGAAAECLLYAPEPKADLIQVIKRHIEALMENRNLRQVISRNCMRMVDGRGVLRVIRYLLGYCSIEIRIARDGDSQKLFEWRNHPSIREVSRNSSVIDWEDHQRWLAKTLADPDRLLLVGEWGGEAVGVVRFDIQGKEVEISIYLVPGVPHAVRGSDLLYGVERWLMANHPNVNIIYAEVLGGNKRSQQLFLGAGYQIESTRYSKRIC